ncbi:MAG: hypothetical protein WC464_02670 [Bdellovibrionales bacterium]
MIELLEEFIHETANIYAIAFVIFWVLIYLYVRKPIFQWLDGEIEKISAELNTAHDLRAEAEAVLEDCKTKQAQAERDAQMIVKMAKQQAETMRQHADAELEASLKHQQQMAAERIQLAQNNAVNAVREAAVTMGVELARKMLTEKLSESDAAKLVEEAIDEIPALKKAKGKTV